MTTQPRRPWYVHNRLCDDWLTIDRNGGDLKMHKSLKLAESIIVNLGIITITLAGFYLGGDVTIFGSLGLFILGAYNGVATMNYLSLLQAIAEVKQQQDSSDNQK